MDIGEVPLFSCLFVFWIWIYIFIAALTPHITQITWYSVTGGSSICCLHVFLGSVRLQHGHSQLTPERMPGHPLNHKSNVCLLKIEMQRPSRQWIRSIPATSLFVFPSAFHAKVTSSRHHQAAHCLAFMPGSWLSLCSGAAGMSREKNHRKTCCRTCL